ncbi:MAG TPA: TonB-dependent receptor [Thermoanaerobaculia bacterium]|nr:TonB-dependent receptor [Thermoanaerobaculia bacterium]
MTQALRRLQFILFTCLLVSTAAFGQTTGSLTGTVTLSGSALPGATVTITSPNMQGSRTDVTDASGNYNFAGIPPGEYTVRFDLEGMQAITNTVRVGLTTIGRADAEMRVSAVAEAITVTASVPTVTETTEVQTNLNAKLIENLPMGRTLLATVNLAPGVNSGGIGGTAISGGFSYDSTYYVDGAVVNEVLRGQPQNLFIEDALQETTVQTGGISAEYGRFTGGVVTAISKSGGNEFSGSIRDSLNNRRWTSQGFLKEPRPDDEIFHTYEATLGGRIIRDRLWFFGAGRDYSLETQALFGKTKATETAVPYQRGDQERRLEGKLTGQITPRNTLVGTFFDINREQVNNAFGTPLEASALDVGRALPQQFYTINYNGVITNSFLLEATYARQDFSFEGSGADAPASPERGTNISVYGGIGRAGFPTFCGSCSFPEERNNSNSKIKGSYFLSTGRAGTHNLTAGYENYHDYLKSDNHQSASDFSLNMYTFDFEGVAGPPPPARRGPNGELLLSTRGASALIIYWPILKSSQGNDFNTQSLFLNDKWDVTNRLNLNLGVRYDKNKGENQAGALVADDSAISPRVGATYDLFGNGRLRVNGSYSRYVSKVANGNVGDATSDAGSPSLLYWGYGGPDITDATSTELLDKVFAWFRSVGFIDYRGDYFYGGGTSGIQSKLDGTLTSPSVDEFTIGLGSQIGRSGFLRVDFQDRKFQNFYTSNTNLSNGKVFDPLAGSDLDLTLVGNSDDFERTYRAVLLQGGYRLFNRLDLGGNYTYSELRGNISGESSGGGPGTAGDSSNFPEYTNFAQNRPIGFLPEDQTHKVRAWLALDVPTFLGDFNFSVLQRFDSGSPYSESISVSTSRTSCAACPVNPGYIEPPTSVGYFISKRGEFRLDDVSATDVAINYELPINRLRLFAQGEVINAFDRQTATGINTSISVIRSFAPRTGSVVECPTFAADGTTRITAAQCRTMFPAPAGATGQLGIYQKGVNFGKSLTPTTGNSLLPGGSGGSFQLPRTYRVSVGLRF